MTSFFEALATNHLLLWATLAGLAASVAGGIMGSYVVVKRIAFISGSISHSVLAGIGLFLWLERTHGITWVSPLSGALIASILSALLIGWIHMSYRQREDSVIAAVWSIGMAVGVLFLSLTPGFTTELANFLVGNILWVSPHDLLVLTILDVIVIAIVALLYERLLAICFDEEQARLQGLQVNKLYILLLTLIAITVVLLMQVVGVILVMTMLTIPATIANLFTKQLSKMMVLSVFLSCIFSFLGTFLAFHLDLPVGATIALLTGASYVISLAFRK
ncbi:MAG: ABC-type transporter, permease subunit [Chlamydiia bacterium]|nr:ABC-type transporter, permease subunit [Chlamydiia bacterium]